MILLYWNSTLLTWQQSQTSETEYELLQQIYQLMLHDVKITQNSLLKVKEIDKSRGRGKP